MNTFEWVKAHKHLQRIGTAFSDVSSLLLDADIQRANGNMAAAAMLAGAARTMVRLNASMRLLNSQKINRPKRRPPTKGREA